MQLGGLMIGSLGLFGNVVLIFLIETNGIIFGQSSLYQSMYPDYSQKYISIKDALLQVYYLSFYGNVFGSVLLLIGTTLRDHRFIYSWLVTSVISISIALLTYITFHFQFRITFLLIPAIQIYFLICVNDLYKEVKSEKSQANVIKITKEQSAAPGCKEQKSVGQETLQNVLV